jgi:hypothetical protein
MDECQGDRHSSSRGIRPPSADRRVSDQDWIRPAIKTVAVLMPGDAKAFRVRELTAAKEWLAEGPDAGGSPSP